MDPAVDWSATDAKEYRESRKLEIVKELPGGLKPAKFYIRPLPATFVLGYLESASIGEKVMLALRAGLFRVEMPNGNDLKPEKTVKLDDCSVATPEWINTIRDKFGMATVYEMATLAIKLAQLSEEERGFFG